MKDRQIMIRSVIHLMISRSELENHQDITIAYQKKIGVFWSFSWELQFFFLWSWSLEMEFRNMFFGVGVGAGMKNVHDAVH